MAITEETEEKRGPSIAVQGAVLLVLTLVAAGAGWVSGGFLDTDMPAPGPAPASEKPATIIGDSGKSAGHASEGDDGQAHAALPANIVELAAITTNLAVPDSVWMRLELSLVFREAPADPELPDLIQQDFLAYIRTVKLMQIEGASGYQHLKSDLLERANIRSKGLVKDVLIRTMLVE